MSGLNVDFPTQGLNEGLPSKDQQVKTSFLLQNVRPFDVTAERIRGGQRPGTVKAYTTRIAGDFPVINMTSIITTYIVPGV